LLFSRVQGLKFGEQYDLQHRDITMQLKFILYRQI